MEPLFDRVKFTLIKEKMIKSDIIDTSINKFVRKDEGYVSSIGPEVHDVKVGDRIKFNVKKAIYIKENEIEVGIVPVNEIYAIIDEDVQKS